MIRAVWLNGQFVPDGEVDLPEGTEVQVIAVSSESATADDADEVMSPDEISGVLAAMERMETWATSRCGKVS